MFILTLLYIYIDPQKAFAVITFLFLIGIVDSVNGVTKSKLTTIASARELKQADEGADVKKVSAATMIDGVLNSPAQECKRGLVDMEGSQGAKSNRKGNKREREEGQFSKCIIL